MLTFLRALIAQVLFVALAGALAAQTSTLTGRLIDTSNVGVVGATVQLDTLSTVTNATGNFTFTALQNRNYTLTILPPAGVYAPQQSTRRVNGATNVGNIVLQPGALVTGTMLAPGGAPITTGNMNAYDAAGVKLFTPGDATSLLGQFAFTVPLGSIRFRTVTPAALSLVPQEQVQTVTGPVNLGTIQLQQGFAVTGSLVDAVTQLPVGNARITTTNGITGADVLQLNPLASAVGAFSLLLPFGSYDFAIDPPTGNTHAPRILHGVIIVAPMSLGSIALQPGVLLTGTVTGPTGPVASTDIDVFTVDGHKLYTPNDNTDGAGNFSVAVPVGTYRLTFQPPIATGLTGQRTAATTVTAATSIGVVTLVPGVRLDITVLGPNGPEFDADLDLLDPVTGEPQVLLGDHTTANGQISTIAPIGTWAVTIDGRQGSLAASLRLPAVPILAPLSLTLPLGTKPLRLDASGLGIQSTNQGGFIPLGLTVQNTTTNTLPILIDVVVRLPSGAELTILPPLPIDVFPLLNLTLGGVFFPIPILPTNELGREQKLLVRARDTATNALLDEAYVQFVVQ